MEQIIECIPNVSCGDDKLIIGTIAQKIKETKGVKLLDVFSNKDTNRTVFTFIGSKESVFEGAYTVIKESLRLIDMRSQSGVHPRIGACDVCPFVPLKNISFKECISLTDDFAKRIATDLGIWVYLYEQSARKKHFDNLSFIRRGSYEGLKKREDNSLLRPDYGPYELNAKFGAVCIGVRKVLVAFNVNFRRQDLELIDKIAKSIRESGGKEKGRGLFLRLKALAWDLAHEDLSQITMNFLDIDISPIHLVFEEILKQAHRYGIDVLGSELVGLIPLKAMTEAGLYFAKKMGREGQVLEKQLIEYADEYLGLSHRSPFRADLKILEYKINSNKKDRETSS